MAKKLLYLQTLLITAGAVFAWSTLIEQLRGFYGIYGTLFRFQNCIVPNPFATPCFYGAVAFVVALVWSIGLILRANPTYTSEKWLRNLLIFGALFAGSVLSYESLQYYHIIAGPQIGCIPGASPLQTPCFVGGLFFLASFIVAIFATRALRGGQK